MFISLRCSWAHASILTEGLERLGCCSGCCRPSSVRRAWAGTGYAAIYRFKELLEKVGPLGAAWRNPDVFELS